MPYEALDNLQEVQKPPVYAGFQERLMAHFLDFWIILAIYIAFFLISRIPIWPKIVDRVVPVGHLIIGWIYFAWMESSPRQATLGKRQVRIRVSGPEGQRINFALASVRYWAMLASIMLGGLPILLMFLNEQKQCFHDNLCGTVVTRDEDSPLNQKEKGSAV